MARRKYYPCDDRVRSFADGYTRFQTEYSSVCRAGSLQSHCAKFPDRGYRIYRSMDCRNYFPQIDDSPSQGAGLVDDYCDIVLHVHPCGNLFDGAGYEILDTGSYRIERSCGISHTVDSPACGFIRCTADCRALLLYRCCDGGVPTVPAFLLNNF